MVGNAIKFTEAGKISVYCYCIEKTPSHSLIDFTLRLKNVTAPETSIIESNLENEKILLVDDNKTNRQLLKQLLKEWKAEYSSVDSAEKALNILQNAAKDKKPYSIALLDMQMPNMDGIKLGEAIKCEPTISAAKLVLLTSQARRGDAIKMHRLRNE